MTAPTDMERGSATTPVRPAPLPPHPLGNTVPPAPADVTPPVIPAAPPVPRTIPAADASDGLAPRLPARLRIQASRERLRDAMTPPPEPPPPPPRTPTAVGRLWKQVRAQPAIGEVVGLVEAWWRTHPLRPAVRAAERASNQAVAPFARQHPWALVAASAAGGALLFKLKPWRMVLRSAVVAGMLPQIAAQVVRHVPLQTWLTLAGTLSAAAGKWGAERASGASGGPLPGTPASARVPASSPAPTAAVAAASRNVDRSTPAPTSVGAAART